MKIFSTSVLAIALAAIAHGQETEPAAAAHVIVDNEAQFYQMGQDAGTKAAFLQFLADDAIVFHPGPVNGKKEWSQRPDKGISIKWHPAFAAMSRSADLGYTTGPAEWRHEKEDEKPFGYGQFISIWKKQKDGAFKVALDVGSEVPGPARTEASEVEYSIVDAPLDKTAANRQLHNAEAKFANVARTDSTAAILGSADDAIRVQREGVFPAIGRDAAGLMLSVRRGQLTQEKLGGGTSEAGDLVYTYGKYTLKLSETTEHGYYLQIWRAEKDGTFKLWLDYATPLPNEQKK